jgi:hypothetical protein
MSFPYIYEKACSCVLISISISIEKCLIFHWFTVTLSHLTYYTPAKFSLVCADLIVTVFSEHGVCIHKILCSTSHVHFQLPVKFQRICLSSFVTFCNLFFLWLGVVRPLPIPQVGGPYLVSCTLLLICYMLTATLNIWMPSPSTTQECAVLW